ncbi:MAG: hypothetical protein AAB916_01705 [Patescibacteria group bacterium]
MNMFRSYLKTRFSKRPQTMEEFVSLLRTNDVTSIDIILAVEPEDKAITRTVGTIANWRHDIRYRGTTVTGKYIVHTWSAYRFGSDHGVADAGERRKKHIHHHLLAEQERRELAEQFPQIPVTIFSATGEILDDAFFVPLREEAEILGIYDEEA